MYISEYCGVNYEEKYNVVLVKWKKFCCMKSTPQGNLPCGLTYK